MAFTTDRKTEILYEELKSIHGISKELIEKALILNKNDMMKTISTISVVTGVKIRKHYNNNNNITLKPSSSSRESEGSDSENESCECNCSNCHQNAIDTAEKKLRKNPIISKIRNVLQSETKEDIDMYNLIEMMFEELPVEIFEAMAQHPELSLELLSQIFESEHKSISDD